MRQIIFFLVFYLLPNTLLLAQKQANIWYFGHYRGLDFNRDSVEVIEGVNSTRNNINAICDTSGDLLFYITDRSEMYNHKHKLVPHLMLNKQHQIIESSIVPHPQNKSVFYIFTLQRQSNTYRYPPIVKKEDNYNKHFTQGYNRMGGEHGMTPKGVSMTFHLYYTCVMVSSNKDIIFLEQNRKLLDFKTLAPSMQVLRHKNHYSVLVSDGAEAFLKVYNIDVKGFHQEAKHIDLASMIDLQDYQKGYITLRTSNKQGNKFLLYTDSDINRRSRHFYYLMSFDSQNYSIRKLAKIPQPPTFNVSHAEFSPNGHKLYINANHIKTIDGVKEGSFHSLYQYDISLDNEETILASKVEMRREYRFDGLGETDVYDLQLAPDGKIYGVSLYRYMYCIHNPNQKGEACNWEQRAIDLGLRKNGGPVLPKITHLLEN